MSKEPKDSAKAPAHASHSPTVRNRRAFHEYHILQRVEAGLVLVGTEVKSLRDGKCQIEDAYAVVRDGEAWLVGLNIAVYPQAVGVLQHDPLRRRKLLLHRRQIAELQRLTDQKGNTLIPLSVFFQRGMVKVELGVAVGKKSYEKRQDIQKRQAQRDIQREMRRRE